VYGFVTVLQKYNEILEKSWFY